MVLKLLYLICCFGAFACAFASTCPLGCNCDSPDMYDCSNAGLTQIINVTDEKVRTLDLSGNKISRSSVIDAEYLTYLSLAKNNLKQLQYDTFDNLDDLITLVLSNNSLSRVTDDIFEWNPTKLEVLFLDGNKLEFIQHFLLYDLEDLTELYLQNNLITFIHPHAFLHLKKLKVLRLDNNHLHTFNSKWLRGLKANMFNVLQFDKNPWFCDCAMDKNFKWMNKTKWFRKRLKHDDFICVEPEKRKGHSVFGNLPGTSQCNTPDIIGISENTTLYVNQSIELDCVVSKTMLPHPQIMWVAPNKDHYNLQTADRYDGIEVFQNGSIIIHRVQHNDSGIYVCVATNTKGSVEAKTMLTVKDLVDLQTPPPVSDRIRNGTDVDRIIDIHSSECPDGCSCVSQHVDCSADSGPPFTEIPYADIPLLTRTLSFASNKITNIKRFTKEFVHMTELRLDDNKIKTIDPHAFDELTSLQTLTMRDNELSSLPPKLFRKLKKLTILVLDNNELTFINDKTFYGLSSLQWLYVRNNYITNISRFAFAKTPKLKFIHLESNHLSSLKEETVTTLTQPKNGAKAKIQRIFVDDNLFQCDCHLEALRLYTTVKNSFENLFGDGLTCSFPPALHGEFLHDINTTLTCNNTNTQKSEELTHGGNAQGNPCHFPFEFKGKIYYSCIKVNQPPFNGKTWCSTTSSFTKDGVWGECDTSDFSVVSISTSTSSSSSSTMPLLWFGGLILGFILCGVGVFVYKKYGNKMGFKSMQYSNLPGYDDTEEHRSLTTNGTSGSEAFV